MGFFFFGKSTLCANCTLLLDLICHNLHVKNARCDTGTATFAVAISVGKNSDNNWNFIFIMVALRVTKISSNA